MNLKQLFSFLFIGVISMSAFSADTLPPKHSKSTIKKSATQTIPPGIQPVARPTGVYKGPNGRRIQVKQAISRGGAVEDLAAKGIVIVDNKPVDGKYVGPGGVSIIVQRGIIIITGKPGQ